MEGSDPLVVKVGSAGEAAAVALRGVVEEEADVVAEASEGASK